MSDSNNSFNPSGQTQSTQNTQDGSLDDKTLDPNVSSETQHPFSSPTTPAQATVPQQNNTSGTSILTPQPDSDSAVSPAPAQKISDADNTNNNLSDLVITSPYTPQKYGGKKVIATIFGLVILVTSIVAGVYLVRNQQLGIGQAWDCSKYTFAVSETGSVTVQNGSSRNEPAQQAKVYINDNLISTLNVPALTSGNGAQIGNVSVPNQGFSWKIVGTSDCQSSGIYNQKINICHVPPGDIANSQSITVDKIAWDTGHSDHNAHSLDFVIDGNHSCPPVVTPTPTNTPSSTPSPTSKPTLTPTVAATSTPTPTLPPEVTAACNDVVAYDVNWSPLSSSQLAQLAAGDNVRIAVSGSTSSGGFDKARFTINGIQQPETTLQKPGSAEFYQEYTIPVGVINFSVSAQIHHSSLGWL